MARRYAILGTGALGGLYGGLLARAGHDVHFLARSDFDWIRAHGLKIETPLGDFTLESPQVYQRAEDMPQVDVVIVAWKTTANASLATTLPAVCGPGTTVLVLQNGLDVEAETAHVVGIEKVLGGCCFLCSNKVGPGHIRHLDFGRIAFGEYSSRHGGRVTERMSRIVDDFSETGIKVQPSEQLAQVRWSKLAWNIPFNGLSVVLDADTKAIMESEAGADLARSLMEDVQASAAACGIAIDPQHIERMLADTKQMVPYDSSMRLDYRHRRPIEVEAIFGNPLRAAQAQGYAAPQIEMLYRQLLFLDARNQMRNSASRR